VAILGLAAVLAFAACRGGAEKAPRSVNSGDLPELALRLSDLPEGYQQVDGCGDANAATPVPTPSDAIFLFFELPTASGTTPSACLMSATVLLDSSDDAARSLDGVDKNFKIVHQPLVDRANCAVEQLHISGLGDDRRGYRTTCSSCLQLYQIAFRHGTVLSEVWLYTHDCPSSRDEAVSYARKQEQRVEAALRDEP
jgi:hypothetical protein